MHIAKVGRRPLRRPIYITIYIYIYIKKKIYILTHTYISMCVCIMLLMYNFPTLIHSTLYLIIISLKTITIQTCKDYPEK